MLELITHCQLQVRLYLHKCLKIFQYRFSFPISTAFASLLSDMWNEGADSSRALNTGPFKAQLQRFAPVFSGYQQHDAQEFLRKLLEGLHEDVNRVTAKPKPITEDIDDDLE